MALILKNSHRIAKLQKYPHSDFGSDDRNESRSFAFDCTEQLCHLFSLRSWSGISGKLLRGSGALNQVFRLMPEVLFTITHGKPVHGKKLTESKEK